jgi:hypothetical protein
VRAAPKSRFVRSRSINPARSEDRAEPERYIFRGSLKDARYGVVIFFFNSLARIVSIRA